MAFLADILTHLSTNGAVDGVSGWACFEEYQPPTPDKCVTLIQSPGIPPDQSTVTTNSYPEFQVRARGVAFGLQELQIKMDEIMTILNNANIAGYTYIYPIDSAPMFLRSDAQDNRPELVLNFKTMKNG